MTWDGGGGGACAGAPIVAIADIARDRKNKPLTSDPAINTDDHFAAGNPMGIPGVELCKCLGIIIGV